MICTRDKSSSDINTVSSRLESLTPAPEIFMVSILCQYGSRGASLLPYMISQSDAIGLADALSTGRTYLISKPETDIHFPRQLKNCSPAQHTAEMTASHHTDAKEDHRRAAWPPNVIRETPLCLIRDCTFPFPRLAPPNIW